MGQCNKKLSKLQENNEKGQTRADIVASSGKRITEEVVKKSLKDRDGIWEKWTKS